MRKFCIPAFLPGILATAFLLLGLTLTRGPATPPDFVTPWHQVLGVLFLVLGLSVSVYALGARALNLCRLESLSPLLAIPLGAGLSSSVICLLGMTIGVGPAGKLPVLGIAIFCAFIAPQKSLAPQRKNKLNLFLILFLCVFILAVLALCARIYPFWDPLWYHLVAPRLWFEAGRIYFPEHHLISFNAGAWDNLYLLGPILLGDRGGLGLPAAQVFGQWIHGFWGFAASAPILYQCFRLTASNRPVRLLSVFASMGIPMVFFAALLAKNDWGVILWLSAALFSLLYRVRRGGSMDGRARRAIELLAGFFLGLAMSTKWTALLAFAPITIPLALELYKKESPRFLLLHSTIGTVLGAFPILLRNMIGTGNPFFPTYAKLFGQDKLGPTWIENLEWIQGKLSFSENLLPLRIQTQLLELTEQSYFIWLFPVFFLAAIFLPRTRRYLPMHLALFGLIVAFFVTSGKFALLRWMAFGILFFVAFSLNLAFEILKLCLKKAGFSNASVGFRNLMVATSLALALLVISDSPFLFLLRSLKDLPNTSSVSEQLLSQAGGPALHWVRQNIRPGEGIAFLQETRVYYVSDLKFTRIWDDPELDRQITNETSALEFLRLLERSGYRYLVDTNEVVDRYQNSLVVRKVRLAYTTNPVTLLFNDERGRVVDITSLTPLLEKTASGQLEHSTAGDTGHR